MVLQTPELWREGRNPINATAKRVEAAGHQVSCAHGVSHLPVWKSWARPKICNKNALSRCRPPLKGDR